VSAAAALKRATASHRRRGQRRLGFDIWDCVEALGIASGTRGGPGGHQRGARHRRGAPRSRATTPRAARCWHAGGAALGFGSRWRSQWHSAGRVGRSGLGGRRGRCGHALLPEPAARSSAEFRHGRRRVSGARHVDNIAPFAVRRVGAHGRSIIRGEAIPVPAGIRAVIVHPPCSWPPVRRAATSSAAWSCGLRVADATSPGSSRFYTDDLDMIALPSRTRSSRSASPHSRLHEVRRGRMESGAPAARSPAPGPRCSLAPSDGPRGAAAMRGAFGRRARQRWWSWRCDRRRARLIG